MDGQSLKIKQETLKKLKEIIPNCFTEDKIDWEKLRVFFEDNIEFRNERYHLSWAGKTDAIRLLQTPTYKTLKPCKDESVNFDETENLFIEGDNLEVLKILQKSYFGKIKMIYIDPPYNTGNDFIYKDDYSETLAEYRKKVGDVDENGNATKAGLFRNTKENGHYHSNWLNMMYPRLFLARNLLRDDGVIFISIDDNEVHNLRLMMDEIFGEENFVGQINIINNLKGRSDDKFFATCNEYLLVYAKNISILKLKGFELTEEEIESKYNLEDEFGPYKLTGFRKTGKGWKREKRPFMYYPILEKNNKFYSITEQEYNLIYDSNANKFNDEYIEKLKSEYKIQQYNVYLPLTTDKQKGRWRWGFKEYKRRINDIVLNSQKTPCVKERPFLEDGTIREKLSKTTWYKGEYDTGSSGKYLKKLFNVVNDIFENPKSLIFLKDILRISTKNSDLILDFFAGSGTTAHAVMELNKEDGGNRKFILVQLPEPTDPKSEAYKAGYKTIADIAKERIRRAAKKIQQELNEEQKKKDGELPLEKTETKKLDLGFKVFKLDESNFKQWRPFRPENAEEIKQSVLEFTENVKPEATTENILYELILKNGKKLTDRIEKKNSFYVINENELVLLLEEINKEIVDEIIQLKPQKVVALDKIFNGNDQIKTNTVLQFKDAGVEFKSV